MLGSFIFVRFDYSYYLTKVIMKYYMKEITSPTSLHN